MIQSRITSKAQTTIPQAVRKALGLAVGDELIWEIEGDRVVVSRVEEASDPFVNNFSTFTEWASKADCEAFDKR
ncbi:MAG: type II toxin-antitoxin system PrlF family antitoxin [Sphingomonadaceae bacterium]